MDAARSGYLQYIFPIICCCKETLADKVLASFASFTALYSINIHRVPMIMQLNNVNSFNLMCKVKKTIMYHYSFLT